jgi:hypothetical protein
MRFTSIEQIIKTLHLNCDATDLAALRKELRARRAAIHPDRLSDHRQSESEQEEWRVLDDAVEFIESLNSETTAMVRLDDLQRITDIVSSSLAVIQKPYVDNRQEKAVERSRRSIQRKYIFPKLTTGALAGILGVTLTIIATIQSSSLFFVPLEDVHLRLPTSSLVSVGEEVLKLRSDVESYLDKYTPSARSRKANSQPSAVERFRHDYPPPVVPSWFGVDFGYNRPDSSHYRYGGRYSYDDEAPAPMAEEVAVSQLFQLESEVDRYTQAVPDLIPDSQTTLIAIRKYGSSLRQFLESLQSSVTAAYRARAIEKSKIEDSRKRQAVEILWVLFGSTSLIFTFVWLRERSDQRWVEFLASDDLAIEISLKRLAASVDGILNEESCPFRKDKFAAVVSRKDSPRFLKPVLGRGLDPARAAGVVTALLEGMIQRGLIRRLPEEGLIEWYSLSPSAIKAIRETERKGVS